MSLGDSEKKNWKEVTEEEILSVSLKVPNTQDL